MESQKQKGKDMYLSKSEIYRQHHNILFQAHRAFQGGMQSEVQKLQSDIIALGFELKAKSIEARQLRMNHSLSNYPDSYYYLIEEIKRLVGKIFIKKKRLKKELENIQE